MTNNQEFEQGSMKEAPLATSATLPETKTESHYYQELPASSTYEVDVIQQLKANLNQLEDLQGRMAFMMTEIRGLVKKS